MRTAEQDISDSIDRTLREEARHNELRIGYVRSSALLFSTSVNLAAYLNPSEIGQRSFPVATVLATFGFFLASLWLIVALRQGHYSLRLRLALPFADGAMIVTLFFTGTSSFEPEYLQTSGVLVNIAALCGLVAVSGGLRLTRSSALLTTGIAISIFAMVCRMAGFDLIRTAFPMSFLLGGGLLGMWMSDVTRRSVQSEVARSILERFLPPQVVNEVHDNPLALISTPRSMDATVVVTDLRGFTSISEKLTPTEVLDFLNLVQGALAEVIHRHGGTIDKFMGDGMLAVFGAPQVQEDHAARAIRAAADMAVAVAAIDAESDIQVAVGVGMHSGEIVAGCLGSGTKLEFTVLGDTVNAASRLESMTKERGVSSLVSEETRLRAERAPGGELPALRPVGEVTLRGRVEPLLVHTLQ